MHLSLDDIDGIILNNSFEMEAPGVIDSLTTTMSTRNLKLAEDYHYILLSAKSTTSEEIDALTVQQSLKSSLLQTCGQTASAQIDVLSLRETSNASSPNNAQGQVVIRVGPSYVDLPKLGADPDFLFRDRNNVLVAITTSATDKTRLAFSVIRESSFLPALLQSANV